VKGLINTRLTSLAWVEGVRRNPAQSRLIRIMVASGMSTRLARHLAEKMPAHYNEDEGDRWLRAALNHFLKVDAPSETILDRGGIYALIGPTGVGKTTSAAKIAALAALRYGSDSIGLITVDAYRMGAMDQLRAFGQLIGSPVHVARDGLELLKGLRGLLNRKIVLIDTVGVGQRDARVGELLTSIAMPSIKKLVVLNAATQSETIEDVVRAYRAQA
jgi:flagellar biosynthesis protein FlhF